MSFFLLEFFSRWPNYRPGLELRKLKGSVSFLSNITLHRLLPSLIATRMPLTRIVSDIRRNEPSTKHQDVFKKAGEIIHDYQVIFFDLATKSLVHDRADIVRVSNECFIHNEVPL